MSDEKKSEEVKTTCNNCNRVKGPTERFDFCQRCLWRNECKYICTTCYEPSGPTGHNGGCQEVEIELEDKSYFNALFSFGSPIDQQSWCYDAHLDFGGVFHETPRFTTYNGSGTIKYGWNREIKSWARNRLVNQSRKRNNTRKTVSDCDPFLSTCLHVPPDANWVLRVPNGDYRLCIFAGDVAYPSYKHFVVNGVEVMNTPRLNGISEVVTFVTVTDGTISLTSGVDPSSDEEPHKRELPRLIGLSVIAKELLSGFYSYHPSTMNGNLVKRKPKVKSEGDGDAVYVRDLPKALRHF